MVQQRLVSAKLNEGTKKHMSACTNIQQSRTFILTDLKVKIDYQQTSLRCKSANMKWLDISKQLIVQFGSARILTRSRKRHFETLKTNLK